MLVNVVMNIALIFSTAGGAVQRISFCHASHFRFTHAFSHWPLPLRLNQTSSALRLVFHFRFRKPISEAKSEVRSESLVLTSTRACRLAISYHPSPYQKESILPLLLKRLLALLLQS